jgi:hypothetical protein
MIDPAVCVGLLRDCHRLRAGALTGVVQCYLGTRNTALGGPGVLRRSHTHTYLKRCSGAVVAGYFCACTQHLPCRTSLVDGDFSETFTSERGFALLHVTATLLRTCGGRTALRLSNDWEDSRPARRRCAVRCIWSARYSKAETCAMGCYFVQRGRTSFIPTRTFVLGVDVRSDVA